MVTARRAHCRYAWRLAAFSLLALAACDLGKTVVPRTEAALVVHAVLNPDQVSLVVLVERSLTGAQQVGTTFDPNNPISGNGIPVTGAIVTLRAPDGFTWTGREQHPGAGVYQIDFDTLHKALRGKQYDLSVSAEGKVVTGSTVVPDIKS